MSAERYNLRNEKKITENPERKNLYIGKDGRDYPTFEALRRADEEYMRIHFPKIPPRHHER
ncbi:MAG: hypothetical protein V1725_00745 [archaeon]